MKKIIVLAVALLLFAPSIVNAGEIRVYDDDDQFLGILISAGSEITIFIPSLNTYTKIGIVPGDGNIFLSPSPWLYIYENVDCTGAFHIYFYPDDADRGVGLIALSDESSTRRYFKLSLGGESCSFNSYNTGPDSICIEESLDNYSAISIIELSEDEIPFTLPVALPLRLEYVSDTPSVPKQNTHGKKWR